METKKMSLKDLTKKFDDVMAATAFAEEGLYDTAREMVGIRQKVLLVLPGRQSDTKCFTYALNFCKRMKAGLEILCSKACKGTIDGFLGDLEKAGIEYHVRIADGCMKKAVLDITRQSQGIDYVVLNSYRGLEAGCGDYVGTLPDVRDVVKCPLVVVGA